MGGGRGHLGSVRRPDSRLGALGEVDGRDVVDSNGTAYVSAWLARRGARPVAVDLTHPQFETARRCQEHFGLTFPLIEASADDVPLPDDSFDLAVSEYGASVWCDPERWIAEAARLLRPRGRLACLTTSRRTYSRIVSSEARTWIWRRMSSSPESMFSSGASSLLSSSIDGAPLAQAIGLDALANAVGVLTTRAQR